MAEEQFINTIGTEWGTVARDPFGRYDIEARVIDYTAKCPWCGEPATFELRIHNDGGRAETIKGAWDNPACYWSYHDLDSQSIDWYHADTQQDYAKYVGQYASPDPVTPIGQATQQDITPYEWLKNYLNDHPEEAASIALEFAGYVGSDVIIQEFQSSMEKDEFFRSKEECAICKERFDIGETMYAVGDEKPLHKQCAEEIIEDESE